jgi:hypothetical protein
LPRVITLLITWRHEARAVDGIRLQRPGWIVGAARHQRARFAPYFERPGAARRRRRVEPPRITL